MLSNQQARESLNNILARPEFSQGRLVSDLEEFLGKLFSWLPEGSGKFSFGRGWGIGVSTLIALAGLVLVFYLSKHLTPFWKTIISEVREEEMVREGERTQSAASLLALAETKAVQGRFREALRDLYLSLLKELDQRQFIIFGAAKTNSEYVNEIHTKARLAEPGFTVLVELFEAKWYGLENCGAADYQKGKDLYNQVLKEVPHE